MAQKRNVDNKKKCKQLHSVYALDYIKIKCTEMVTIDGMDFHYVIRASQIL